MTHTRPIGIFDSGVGGTSIFKQIHRLLPNEKIIYLADSKNAPYGRKSQQEIIELCQKNTALLRDKYCKLIVVACNTATTNAIDYLRSTNAIPFIGIEPAIKPAALNSSKKCIGVLATEGTLTSALFAKTSQLFAKETELIEVKGNGLVEAIERGEENTPSTRARLRTILAPLIKKKADYLVLGCTHYPYLTPLLTDILPPEVTIIDSGKAVARQTKAVLRAMGALASKPQGLPEFYTNKSPNILKRFVDHRFSVSYLDF